MGWREGTFIGFSADERTGINIIFLQIVNIMSMVCILNII